MVSARARMFALALPMFTACSAVEGQADSASEAGGVIDEAQAPLTGSEPNGGEVATDANDAHDANRVAQANNEGAAQTAGVAANGLLPLPAAYAWPSTVHVQADAALQALMRNHWGTDFFGSAWPFAHALDVMVDSAVRTSGRRYAGLADSLFWRLNNLGYANYGSTVYYDDMNWMALALLRLYAASLWIPQLGGRSNDYLAAAKTYFAKVSAAEVKDAQGNTQGVWWDSAHTQRATVANGGAALTGALLYALTQDATALAFAKRVYAHWTQIACSLTTFTVNDHVDAAGTVSSWQFTYNYGVMVGAALALHRATGEAAYLQHARGFAHKMVTSLGVTTGAGRVLQESCKATCTGDARLFKGIGLRYLAELAQADPNNAEVTTIVANSATSLGNNFNVATGHFPIDWSVAAGNTNDMGADISGTMGLAVVAALARTQMQQAPPALSFQAGHAELTGSIGLQQNGQTGDFGVPIGWNKKAQQLNWRLMLPYASRYDVALRSRATQTSTTSRHMLVAPANVSASLSFGQGKEATAVTTVLTLPAGRNVVTLTPPADGAADVTLVAMGVAPHPPNPPKACGQASQLSLQGPVLDAPVCAGTTFSWVATGGDFPAYDVVVDGNVVCQSSSSSCSVAMLGALASGPHTWYVLGYDGCGASLSSPAATFQYAPAVPTAPAPKVELNGSEVTVSWSAGPAAAGVRSAVELNGALVCTDLPGSQCSMDGFDGGKQGKNTAQVTVQNSCGRRVATAVF